MSSLTDSDKSYLEVLFDMQDGGVLNFTDARFGSLFKRHNIDIHSHKYQTDGTSIADKMRAFWEKELDSVVAQVLSEMLDSYQTNCSIRNIVVNYDIFGECQRTVLRLLRAAKTASILQEFSRKVESRPEDDFLEQEFAIPNIHQLPIESQVATIIETRLQEVLKVLNAGAYLSVIFLCGSVLEGVLLGAAQKEPKRFNQSNASPKFAEGKVKPFHEWSLAQLIDVASDIGMFEPDVQKFSHGLRDFRNYIHPYAQMTSGFSPDEHTAKVCFQVLKAALASITGDR